ncbi:MAG: DUF2927 domain-containing protein [Pseudomonadota bacterium]
MTAIARRFVRMPILLLLLLAVGCTTQPSREEYLQYEATLRSLGDLRTERAPLDAPFSNEDLVRNFERIALRGEVDIERSGSETNSKSLPLRRWEQPLRYRVLGSGATAQDRARIDVFMRRIGGLTGLPVVQAGSDANLLILVTTPEERDAVSAALFARHPGLGVSFDTWRRSRRIVCAATNLVAPDADRGYVFGLVIVGDEVSGLLRESCFHEEITQVLGLGNDHPEVRPSIFNDDEEFALLTEHDEWLVRLLYHDRLRPGMTEDEALPIVREVIGQLRPEGER